MSVLLFCKIYFFIFQKYSLESTYFGTHMDSPLDSIQNKMAEAVTTLDFVQNNMAEDIIRLDVVQNKMAEGDITLDLVQSNMAEGATTKLNPVKNKMAEVSIKVDPVQNKMAESDTQLERELAEGEAEGDQFVRGSAQRSTIRDGKRSHERVYVLKKFRNILIALFICLSSC